ncbi:FxsA family protein [Virgibacillus halodenitrificans]|uniref:FxsA family protein n=1 Tax=Virgibacillus halodenitrificans TaxID=1482 RepID=UPI001FB28F6C|nr:FxsA family protein [Virgibacillus halodenitrificans]MCJ0931729.1 FxsA family protein [Virgibacillus halodenitrificans]
MRWLMLTLLVLAALEIGVFIWIGGLIGPWWVVLLIILTGIIGITLAKQQGIETWNRAQLSISNGQMPTAYIMDGICIFTGAVFLFTPGFITDAVGFLLVLPYTRGMFRDSIQKLLKRLVENKTIIYKKW